MYMSGLDRSKAVSVFLHTPSAVSTLRCIPGQCASQQSLGSTWKQLNPHHQVPGCPLLLSACFVLQGLLSL